MTDFLIHMEKIFTPDVVQAGIAFKPAVIYAVLISIATYARYFFISGTLFYLFNIRKISSRVKHVPHNATRRQIKQEMFWSTQSCGIMILLSIFVYFLVLSGNSKVYLTIAKHGWPYFFASFFFLLLAHDTYHYWQHRLAHSWPWFYRRFHTVHHQFTNPTSYSDLALHPVDALLTFAFGPLFLVIIPIHPVVYLAFMAFAAIINNLAHIGYEILPKNTTKNLPLMGTLTMHLQHHTRGYGNYGLYFTFWDRVAKTLHHDYEDAFARNTSPSGQKKVDQEKDAASVDGRKSHVLGL